MGFAATIVFYHLIGLGVGAAVFLSDPGRGRLFPAFRAVTAVVFWPLYLPILLAGARAEPLSDVAPRQGEDEGDTMSQAISQVQSELEVALASLDGWAEDVLARETDRFRELGTAWRAQAERIREIDRLLARTDRSDPAPPPALSAPQAIDRYRQSEQTRRANFDRLQQIRGRAYEDLMGTLTWVRELVSMIHLAKFTGAPASRAGELVAQIAAAVEGISAVTWQDDQAGVGPTTSPTFSREETVPCDYSGASATSLPPI